MEHLFRGDVDLGDEFAGQFLFAAAGWQAAEFGELVSTDLAGQFNNSIKQFLVVHFRSFVLSG